MNNQTTISLEELRDREERATIDYFEAIRRGAQDPELRDLLGELDNIYCLRRRQEGISVDW